MQFKTRPAEAKKGSRLALIDDNGNQRGILWIDDGTTRDLGDEVEDANDAVSAEGVEVVLTLEAVAVGVDAPQET